MSDSHYHIPARKTRYRDQWDRSILYDSILEARMARILDRAAIEFEAHVLFEDLRTPEHKLFSYTLDFVFKKPQKFVGIPDILNGIEIKGALTRHDMIRIDALEYFKGVKAWIVGDMMIDFWEREGAKK